MTRVGFIRHGTTAWNKEHRAQGSSDIPLDHDGLAEARQLAERLSQEKWDAIYSSHLQRAAQTAGLIQERREGLSLQLDERLREVGGGQIEGTTHDERVKKWGENWNELDLGIENSKDAVARALEALEEITSTHTDKNILVVSHGSLLSHLLNELVPDLDRSEFLKNTSLSVLKKTEDGWETEIYNCTRHLTESKV